MIPSGAVIPDPTMSLGSDLAGLFGVTAVLAVFAVLVTFALVVAGLISEIQARAVFRRMVAGNAAALADAPEAAIEVTAPPHAA